MKLCFPLCLSAPLLWALVFTPPATAQIPGPTDTSVRSYAADGMTDQPFTVEIIGARRSVNNVLLVRLALTNRGTAPLQPHQDFAGDSNPTDDGRISALFAVDPNGRKKYGVIRDGRNQPLCSQVMPPLAPGERRVLDTRLLAPPDTTSAIDLYFPKATPIPGVPIGLPEAGEPLPGGATIVAPVGPALPAAAAPIAPTIGIDQPTSNNLPNVYTNESNPTTPGRGTGSIQSANSDTPFTVEALDLRGAKLRFAVTNNGSGDLDAAGQFNGEVVGSSGDRSVSGMYLVDPVSKQRFNVLTAPKIDPVLGPGERRIFQAQFPPIPAAIKSVYVYFPHTTPIANVPVTP